MACYTEFKASRASFAVGIRFAPGQTSKTITVQIFDDRLPESSENFVVNLSNAMNVNIADSQGVGTIYDNEPRISIGDVTKKEGNGKKTTLFTFTVTLSVAYDLPLPLVRRQKLARLKSRATASI